MRKLQKLNKKQMVKLLDAINREGVDNQFWAVSSYENSWNAGEVAVDWMRYKFAGSYEYISEYCHDGYAIGNNVGNAIDATWTWFHTGFVNNFISKDPETCLLHLNW